MMRAAVIVGGGLVALATTVTAQDAAPQTGDLALDRLIEMVAPESDGSDRSDRSDGSDGSEGSDESGLVLFESVGDADVEGLIDAVRQITPMPRPPGN